MRTFVSGTDKQVCEYRRHRYEDDPATFSSEAYREKGGCYAVAWTILGWEVEPDEDTEWSGYENRTGKILAVMVGDDRPECFDKDDLEPIAREDYCGSCGQIGCTHDGLDREAS